MDEFLKIFQRDVPEIKKLADGFDYLTRMYQDSYQHQAEIAQAMQDTDNLVKEQIKMEMMKFVRSMFNDCYYQATGRRAWDE